MNRAGDNLKALGSKTKYSMDYAPEVLETFENKHKENDYWVRFNCPEFTSLCPITGQPDFAEIRIEYIPDVKMVESKSLKLYLFSFRNHGDHNERPYQADESQVYRSGRVVHTARRHKHISVCKLWQTGNKV